MKREQGVDAAWLAKRARVLVPLVDRLNHIGEYVQGLEQYSNDVDVAEALSGLNDLLSKTMASVARREELPFTESTFRNYLRRFPAFEHRVGSAPNLGDVERTDEDTLAQTTKLMNWLQLE